MNTKTTNSRQGIVVATVIALLIGSGTGYWIASGKSVNSTNKPVTAAEKKPLFYRNPMNPAITSPVPVKDEMGMDYVPVYPGGDAATGAPTGTVKIDPTVVQDIGVRTIAVKRATLSRDIRTIGRVTYDEQRVTRLHPKYDGWVEKLFIDKTGEQVKKGMKLLSIYSPQLVATQEEYLLALDNEVVLKNSPFPDVRKGAQSLLSAVKQRLQLLDVPDHQIKSLETKHKIIKGMPINSPFNGVVMNIGAREGERITPDTELYMITDLSRVWVIVDIYEDDIPWVHKGDTANIEVAGIPGRVFHGKVTYIYPYLEARTRTIKVRIELDNPGLTLKLEMFANVNISADKQINALVVPSESIVRTGTQDQVFVQRAPGQFEPRRVVVGVSSNGQVQIKKGLKAGEIVVTSSQFLIDSESKLKEATAKMMEVLKSKSVVTPATVMQTDILVKNPAMKMPGMKKHSMEGMNGGTQQ